MDFLKIELIQDLSIQDRRKLAAYCEGDARRARALVDLINARKYRGSSWSADDFIELFERSYVGEFPDVYAAIRALVPEEADGLEYAGFPESLLEEAGFYHYANCLDDYEGTHYFSFSWIFFKKSLAV